MPRKPKVPSRRVSILVRRGDVELTAENVPASEVGALAGVLWCELRALVRRYPDMDPPDLQQVGTYAPVEVPHEGDDENPPETRRRKRVGFTTLQAQREADGADLTDT